MERRTFCALNKCKGIIGVQIKSGYELEIAGRKFYGYMSEDQTIYIIDPRNGLVIASCCYDFVDYDESTAQEVIEDEVQCIKYAAKRMIDQGVVEKLKKKEKKRSYKLAIKAFKAFVKAELLLEKQRVAAEKECQAEERKVRKA